MIEEFTILSCEQLPAIEDALFAAAPLIRHLEISMLKNPEALGHLQQCRLLERIRSLRIKHSQVGDRGLELISNCTGFQRVQSLEVAHCELGSRGLTALGLHSPFEHLLSLEIGTCSFPDPSTKSMSRSFRPDAVWGLKQFPKLQELLVGSYHGPADISDLCNHSRPLRRLSISNLKRDDLQRLAQSGVLDEVEDLSLSGSELGIDLSRCQQLRKLSLTSCDLDDNGLAELLNNLSPGLIRLDLSDNRLTDLGIQRLAACPAFANLRYLHLGANQWRQAGAEALAQSQYLTKLVALKVNNTPLGPRAVQTIVQSPIVDQLRFLDVWETRCGDIGAQAIATARGLKKLNWLNLDDNGVGPNGAEALANSQTLNEITAFRFDNPANAQTLAMLIDRFGQTALKSYWRGYLI
ncbi:hypothetical protein NA78x_002068 [Anatilimnocola sp. NA78]|uniref:hypothetical protein n=1 Tax=Anatilimnocola sp. NA78 TaxID=3415683 RepID=UPI003CE47D13